MSDSILISTKKLLGISADDTSFDVDVMMHINSALATLSQLGVGPSVGFMIEDAVATWEQFLGQDKNFNSAKTLVYFKVRLAFDPPATSFGLNALKEQIQELEWRLNVQRETVSWTDPDPKEPRESVWGDPLVIDGGAV